MRTDPHFRARPDADADEIAGLGDVSELGGMNTERFGAGGSLSGKERNHLFWNRDGVQFEDVAAISGLDHPADGRAVSLLDYDRDGWLDFAVANANTPLFQLFRNRIGELPGTGGPSRGVLAVRLEGANRSAQPAPGRSNRDGVGALLEVSVDGARLLREVRAGEGFAAQSSATQLVGLGAGDGAPSLRVRWPSGTVQERTALPRDVLVTVFEDPGRSPDGSGFSLEPYRASTAARDLPRPPPGRALAIDLPGDGEGPQPPVRLLTTMATWCEVCRGELPQIAVLRAAFPEARLGLVGLPVDEDDDPPALRAYRERYRPAYELIEAPTPEQVEAVQRIVREDLKIDALPATLVLDRDRRVLRTLDRLPSVSEVARWLAEESG